MRDTGTSKFLSLILRHKPSIVGIHLDEAGWVDVTALLAAMVLHGHPIDRARLERIVAQDGKGRYALDAATGRIRANQGHSVEIDLGLQPQEPPALLLGCA